MRHLQFRFQSIAIYTVLLPLSSFVFCIIWSVTFHFEPATFTHCHVQNYLPSISAAIGNFTPQRYVWQLCVAVHSAPRFLVVWLYHRHLYNFIYAKSLWRWFVDVISFLQASEVFSLLGLTIVSSIENFPVHRFSFGTFMLSALTNMLLLYLILKYGSKNQQLSAIEMRSLKWKRICGMLNFFAAVLAVYFYYRHNLHCEPFIYTYFAVSEYVVVATNMGYHMTAYWDFSDLAFTVTSSGSVSIPSKSIPKSTNDDFVVKVA